MFISNVISNYEHLDYKNINVGNIENRIQAWKTSLNSKKTLHLIFYLECKLFITY